MKSFIRNWLKSLTDFLDKNIKHHFYTNLHRKLTDGKKTRSTLLLVTVRLPVKANVTMALHVLQCMCSAQKNNLEDILDQTFSIF